jgi:hypothetical protein
MGTDKRASVQERSKLGLRWGSVTWPNSRHFGRVTRGDQLLSTGFLRN